MAEVGQETDLNRRRVEHEPHGISGGGRDGKCIHAKITDFKAVAGFKNLKIKSAIVVEPNLLGGMAVAVNGNAKLGGEHLEAVNVVGMFVRDENTIEPFRGAFQIKQGGSDALGAEAAVDEHPHAWRFQIRCVATGSTAQDSELHLLHGHRVKRGQARHNCFSSTN